MCDDSEEAEGARGGLEEARVGDGLQGAVRVDVFDLADVVAEGAVGEAGAVADGGV